MTRTESDIRNGEGGEPNDSSPFSESAELCPNNEYSESIPKPAFQEQQIIASKATVNYSWQAINDVLTFLVNPATRQTIKLAASIH